MREGSAGLARLAATSRLRVRGGSLVPEDSPSVVTSTVIFSGVTARRVVVIWGGGGREGGGELGGALRAARFAGGGECCGWAGLELGPVDVAGVVELISRGGGGEGLGGGEERESQQAGDGAVFHGIPCKYFH